MSDFNKLSGSDEKNIFDKDAWGVNTIGVIITTLIISILFGVFFQSGLGELLDGFIGLIVALFALTIGAFLAYLMLNFTNKFPRFYWVTFGAVLFTLSIFLISRKDLNLNILFFVTLIFILIQGFLVAIIWTLISGRLRFIKHQKRILARLLILFILAFDIGIYYVLGGNYIEDHQTFTPRLDNNEINNTAAGFTKENEFRVNSFFYGSGNDTRRSTYNEGVAFESESFDLSAWLPTEQKHFSSFYEWFWGFNAENIPLNANVWIPETDSLKHPIVFIIHGQEDLTEEAENGFDYLSEKLSGIGFIAVSIDLNFFNDFWLNMSQQDRIIAKSIVVLKHIEAWQRWNMLENHALYNKLDTTANITLVGHGEGSLVSWKLAKYNRIKRLPSNANKVVDTNFSIGNIIALSPIDFLENSHSTLNNINFLAINGGYNTRVSMPLSNTQYEYVHFSDTNKYYFKDDIYMHHGNYSQFNEQLEGKDGRPPFNWLINQSAVISGKLQRDFTKMVTEAFLEFIYKDREDFHPIFQNTYNAGNSLPQSIYFNQFEDNSFIPLANFDEDENPVTATYDSVSLSANNLKVWEEIYISSKLGYGIDKGLLLAWNSEGWQNLGNTVKRDSTSTYELELHKGFGSLDKIDNYSVFNFSLIYLDNNASAEHNLTSLSDLSEEVNFSIEFIDTIGVVNKIPFRNLGKAAIPLTKKGYKIPWLSKNPVNLHLQTYYFPVINFLKLNPEFNLSSIGKIRFVFDKTLKGKLLFDDIGFNVKQNSQLELNDGSLDTQR